MNALVILTTGIITVVAFSACTILYFKGALRAILNELCEKEERAAFWMAFTNMVLILVPLLVVLHLRPEGTEETQNAFAVIDMIKVGLSGIMITVIIMGGVIKNYIPAPEVRFLPSSKDHVKSPR